MRHDFVQFFYSTKDLHEDANVFAINRVGPKEFILDNVDIVVLEVKHVYDDFVCSTNDSLLPSYHQPAASAIVDASSIL